MWSHSKTTALIFRCILAMSLKALIRRNFTPPFRDHIETPLKSLNDKNEFKAEQLVRKLERTLLLSNTFAGQKFQVKIEKKMLKIISAQ